MARISGVKHHDSDAASILAYLTVAEFTCHFNYKFPQKEPWHLRLQTGQRSISCIQCCTQSGRRGTVRFHPLERLHRLVAMGGILHMAVNPRITHRIQGLGYIPPYFPEQLHTGLLSAERHPIHKLIMEKYLRSVGQIFAAVGTTDPRLNIMERLDFRIAR